MTWLNNSNHVFSWLLGTTIVLVLLWESLQPLRRLEEPMLRRWLTNSLLFAISSVIFSAVIGANAVLVAMAVSNSRFGLLNRSFLPAVVQFIAALLLLDLMRYGRHYLMHVSRILWRFHQVHHCDPDFDWSTGFRFHPLEDAFVIATDLAAIALLAPPPAAVAYGAAVVIVVNIMVHGNVSLPSWLERWVRHVVFTPDLHRTHHSADEADFNSNYGVIFPWWDRLFGTYHPSPAAHAGNLQVGLLHLRDARVRSIFFLLALPFRRQ